MEKLTRSLRGKSESAAMGGEKSHFAPVFPAVATATVLKSGAKSGSFPTHFASTLSAAQTPGVHIDEEGRECERHGNFTSRAIRLGERILHWSRCPACSRIEAERVADDVANREAAERQKRLEARLDRAGIPQRFRSKTFASFSVNHDGQEAALAIAMEFANHFDTHAACGTTAVFSGLPGTGKSHLAIAAGQEIMKKTTVLYISAIDAVRMIRDTWRRDAPRTESQVIAELAGVGLLILDEIGVQHGTESEQVLLFDIIDKRYRDLRPMILLTNLNKSGMKTFLGDRSFDRLRESGSWTVFDWPSLRPKAVA